MAKNQRFGNRFGVGAVALSTALLGSAGEPRAQALSCTGLPHSGFATSSPVSCTVNCSAGGTIASALALRPQTTSTLTVTINGTCVESVDHVPSGVTLQAGPSGATLQAPSASTDPVLGISGIGVTLDNLMLSGGVNTLRGRSGSAFTGNNLVIEGASNADVLLNHSVVTLNTSTIQNSANDGIDADYGSTAFLNGGVVQQNGGRGINAFANGSVRINGGGLVQKNTLAGGFTSFGGSIGLFDGTVQNNTGPGLWATNAGSVQISGAAASVVNNGSNGVTVDQAEAFIGNGANIAGNSGNGIFLYDGGTGVLFNGGIVQSNAGSGILVESGNIQIGGTISGGSGGVTVKNNGGNGITLQTNSVGSFASSANQIVKNTGWGIFCTGSPSNPLIKGTVGTVTGNGAGQISCNVSP